jgi:hypothetical protein
MNTTTELSEITPLILAGDGYQLTISSEAEARKAELITKSAAITTVTSNDESANAQFHSRSLAAMRIEVEKSRKLVKEPVNRIGKMIDNAAADFLAEIVSEENRIKKIVGDHAEEVLRIKAEKEGIEREAFEAARAAKEEAENGGIAAVLAAKKALADKIQSSNEVAATRLADGIRFAWDFEVESVSELYCRRPDLVELTPSRSRILALIKQIEEEGGTPFINGLRLFKKPIVSSR